jgi:alkylhydroperoxidase family enzyme
LARRHGWTDDQIKDLANFEKRPDFTDQEKLALRVAEIVTRDSHSLDDALFAELLREFHEDGTVELLSAVGLFNYFNMFNNALKMEPTK